MKDSFFAIFFLCIKRKAKNGAGKAVVAIAKKLVSIYYKMITDKVAFDAQKMRLIL